MAKCENTKYKPVDSVDIFKNTVNPQRTCGVIIQQVTQKQCKVRYGDNQHSKVTTYNMVPVVMLDTEDNPEDINRGNKGGYRFDTTNDNG